jgi:uncharacterized protein
MSVLNCPVCQGAMREVERQGVLIDTCTQCRGVWLDRGELEKLAGAIGGPGTAAFNAAPPHDSRDASRNRGARLNDDYDEDEDDRRYRDGQPQRSKMSRLMDFFD